jgi:flavin reductase (DIM6/NTAB) family NADH-FMN oxidoreductase RutF
MQSFPGTDAEAYLALARTWASTVNVVTVRRTGDGKPDGFTATAFLTVSLRPPLVCISASNETSAGAMLRDSASFVVNLLSAAQAPLAVNFALSHAEREDLWGKFPWRPDAAGVPVLVESLGAFSAERQQLVEAGDHTLVVGRVTQVHRGTATDALVYANRAYGRVQPL